MNEPANDEMMNIPAEKSHRDEDDEPMEEIIVHDHDDHDHDHDDNGDDSTIDLASNRPRATAIKIVAASYGPAEGRRLLTGELITSESECLPYTRDVTSFLRALLISRGNDDTDNADEHKDSRNRLTHNNDIANNINEDGNVTGSEDDNSETLDLFHMRGRGGGNFIPLMEGKPMNVLFGDPCPGTCKKLNLHYILYASSQTTANSKGGFRSIATEVHRVSFSEHEQVLLRKRFAFYQDDSSSNDQVIRSVPKLPALGQDNQTPSPRDVSKPVAERSFHKKDDDSSVVYGMDGSTIWSLRPAVSEVVLPIVLPFLQVTTRVQCQLVCKAWRFVIRDWGVAQRVDINDPSFRNFTRSFFRGIVAHSYSSLHSLFLNDFRELTKEDFHPAIPHLRKLRSLDISRCVQLDDSTLKLLAEHTNKTLKVLYMKGLGKVTDDGLISICQSCTSLEVLEISNIPITDRSGAFIGHNLKKLRALYMRDNFLLTNASIDVITEKCTQLAQLTLWGSTRLRGLSFEQPNLLGSVGCGKLVLLNLWGCHSLLDEVADSLCCMRNLRSLIVSECHRLTDAFLTGISRSVPQLHHLSLRYCKRVTDVGINAIAGSMRNLYSLDLSFCTRITSSSLINLVDLRYRTLFELRLRHCTQLDIAASPSQIHSIRNRGDAGQALLGAVRSHGNENCLSVLDIHNCGGATIEGGFSPDCPFTDGMRGLLFEQKLPGFFSRPARWDSSVQHRLVDKFNANEL